MFLKKYLQLKWVVFGLVILLLRLPSLFEGWWYLDENIYLGVGQGLARGELLYVDVWDHKPPLTYLIYGFLNYFFGNSLFYFRLVNSLLAAVSIFSFYKILEFIFKTNEGENRFQRLTTVTTMIYGLSTTLLFEGLIFNSENIFVPLVLTGFYLLLLAAKHYQQSSKILYFKLILGSFLWGLALLTKAHTAVEIFGLAFALLALLLSNEQNQFHFPKIRSLILKKQFVIILSLGSLFTLLPIVSFALYYRALGRLNEFLFAILFYNQSYVSTSRPAVILGLIIPGISWQAYNFLLWLVLFCGFWILFLKQKIGSKFLLLLLWFISTWLAVLMSARGYPHYLLQAVPATLALIAYVFATQRTLKFNFAKYFNPGLVVLLLLIYLPMYNGPLTYTKPLIYQYNFYASVFAGKGIESWNRQEYPYLKVQTELLQKIKSETKPQDRIYIIAESPELYSLSENLSGNKYLIDFHIQPDWLTGILQEVEANKTALIIVKETSRHGENTNAFLEASPNYQLQEILTIDQQNYYFWKLIDSDYTSSPALILDINSINSSYCFWVM